MAGSPAAGAYGGDYDGNVWVDDRAYPVGELSTAIIEWTPDGRSLLYERGGIRLLDTETGKERLVAPGAWPSLSPDGQSVAYLRFRRQKHTGNTIASSVQVVPLDGGEPHVLARTSGSPFGRHFESRPHWLPDGSGVAVARRVTPEGIWAVEVIGLDGTTRVVAPQIGEEVDFHPTDTRLSIN